jgi:hypothetical protein
MEKLMNEIDLAKPMPAKESPAIIAPVIAEKSKGE